MIGHDPQPWMRPRLEENGANIASVRHGAVKTKNSSPKKGGKTNYFNQPTNQATTCVLFLL
jgi:hypothetical protein